MEGNIKQNINNILSIAYASLLKLETQYLLSLDLNYLNKNEIIKILKKKSTVCCAE